MSNTPIRVLLVEDDLGDADLICELLELAHSTDFLLSNAIKYSPDGGAVQIRLTCEERKLIFQVQDEGIGIPKEDQLNLFKSFSRASNVGTIAGTGLGLSIIKKCVDLHGGQIAVKSEVGVGTTFSVSLPLDRD